MPEALTNAKKLADVVNYLIDEGVSDPDDIKARCAELKERVPALSRIPNLDERIDRTLDVIDMGEDQG